MIEQFAIATGTATLCVFDLAALKHRVADYPDWWSDEEEELREVNAGNAIFVALGSDGQYNVEFRTQGAPPTAERAGVVALLRCPSGRVFVGPGEDVSGGDLQPDRRQTTGRFFDLPGGLYRVHVVRLGTWAVGVLLETAEDVASNALTSGLSIAE